MNEIELLRAEIERLRIIERQAQTVYDYHMLGYRLHTSTEFDADIMLDLLNRLGLALEQFKRDPAKVA